MSILNDSSGQGRVARKTAWSDLDLAFIPQVIAGSAGDIIPLKDDKAVKYAVKNLILSNFYDRPFQATCGANLRGLLFEPNDAITRIVLRENIREVISAYEPRISLRGLYIEEASQGNSYKITVAFQIKESSAAGELDIVLRRLR